MIETLKPYPAMKDSGAPWLGAIPETWNTRKFRQCGALQGGMTPSMETRHYWGGTIPWVTPKDMKTDAICGSKVRVTDAALSQTALHLIRPPAVLMVVRGMILARKVPVAWTTLPVTINQDMKALTPGRGISARYLAYIMQSAQPAISPMIDEAGHGTRRLPTERLRDLILPIPHAAEQTAIVRFLGYADRRIRRYIRAKQKLIKLLEEQKQAIIHRAVTRGLDPNVLFKNSGLPWIGGIPEHWNLLQIRRLISFVTSGSRGWASYYSDSGDIFLQSGNLGRSMSLNLSFVQHVEPPAGSEGVRTRVQRDDILVCITGALTGNVALVDVDLPAPAYVNQHVALVRAKPSMVFPRYLASVLHSEVGKAQFKTSEYGGTKQGLGLGDVRSIVVPLPSVPEQISICTELEKRSESLTVSIQRVGHEISLLREYRTRLIADVVTGKLDVREAAANLPDEGDEAELPEGAAGLLDPDSGDEPADPDVEAASEETEE